MGRKDPTLTFEVPDLDIESHKMQLLLWMLMLFYIANWTCIIPRSESLCLCYSKPAMCPEQHYQIYH